MSGFPQQQPHGYPEEPPYGYSYGPPNSYSQPMPNACSQPAPGGYSQSLTNEYSQPPPSNYSQPPSGSYWQPPSFSYSQAPPNSYSQPQGQQAQHYNNNPPTPQYTPQHPIHAYPVEAGYTGEGSGYNAPHGIPQPSTGDYNSRPIYRNSEWAQPYSPYQTPAPYHLGHTQAPPGNQVQSLPPMSYRPAGVQAAPIPLQDHYTSQAHSLPYGDHHSTQTSSALGLATAANGASPLLAAQGQSNRVSPAIPQAASQHHNQDRAFSSEEVAMYLSRHNCTQIPASWQPLPPAWRAYWPDTVASSWIENPEKIEYHTRPDRDRKGFSKKDKKAYSGAAFAFKLKEHENWFSDNKEKYHWKLYDNIQDGDWDRPLWQFQRKVKERSGKSKIEFHAEHGTAVEWTFENGKKMRKGFDELSFTNPSDGMRYVWQTDRHISMLGGWRYDFVRYAMFRVQRHGYGMQIVADVAVWDGHASDPDEAVSIRAANVDDAMVLATYQLFKEMLWEEVLRVEQAEHSAEFAAAVESARQTKLGRAAHWTSKDAGEDDDFGVEVLQSALDGLSSGGC